MTIRIIMVTIIMMIIDTIIIIMRVITSRYFLHGGHWLSCNHSNHDCAPHLVKNDRDRRCCSWRVTWAESRTGSARKTSPKESRGWLGGSSPRRQVIRRIAVAMTDSSASAGSTAEDGASSSGESQRKTYHRLEEALRISATQVAQVRRTSDQTRLAEQWIEEFEQEGTIHSRKRRSQWFGVGARGNAVRGWGYHALTQLRSPTHTTPQWRQGNLIFRLGHLG